MRKTFIYKVVFMFFIIISAVFYRGSYFAQSDDNAAFTYVSVDRISINQGEAITFIIRTINANYVFSYVDGYQVPAVILEDDIDPEDYMINWQLVIFPLQSQTVTIYANTAAQKESAKVITLPVMVYETNEIYMPVEKPFQPIRLRMIIGSEMYTINGNVYFTEASPFISEGRTMVHLSTIANALGAQASWDAGTRTATVQYVDIHFILIANNVPLPRNMGTPMLRDGRIFVPLAYISEHFNVDVKWDSEAQAVYISKDLPARYRIPSVLPEDSYDHNAIIAAWRRGDKSGASLSRMNREVLLMASSLINEIVNDEMTDAQIKMAFYHWFIDNVPYDRQFLNRAPGARPNPNSDNAYGALVNRTAICYGYAYAYQLIMDMLGIPGVTVHGRSPTGAHAWNVVEIDGVWRLVDIPWRLVNVSSQYMWNRGFRWDRASIPEAR